MNVTCKYFLQGEWLQDISAVIRISAGPQNLGGVGEHEDEENYSLFLIHIIYYLSIKQTKRNFLPWILKDCVCVHIPIFPVTDLLSFLI